MNTYLTTARQAVKGFMVIGTFSVNGPKKYGMLDVHQYTEEKLLFINQRAELLTNSVAFKKSCAC